MNELWKHYAKWKKPDTEGQLRFHLCEISRIGTQKTEKIGYKLTELNGE